MEQLLLRVADLVIGIHDYIVGLNDAAGLDLSDKTLHFLVMGLLGLGLIFLAYPLFRFLVRRNKIMTITWICVTTLLIAVSIAIEICQMVTGNGKMELADVAYGIGGYTAMFLTFLFIRWLFRRGR